MTVAWLRFTPLRLFVHAPLSADALRRSTHICPPQLPVMCCCTRAACQAFQGSVNSCACTLFPRAMVIYFNSSRPTAARGTPNLHTCQTAVTATLAAGVRGRGEHANRSETERCGAAQAALESRRSAGSKGGAGMNWGSSALTRTAIDGGAHCGGAGAGVGAADVHEHVLVLHVTGSGCWFGRSLPCMSSICCRSRCRSTASQSALEGVRRQRLPLASSGLNPLQNNPMQHNPIQHNNNATRREWA